jgi:predicted nucleic acid-binding protein
MTFLDTSVLVPLFGPYHIHAEASRRKFGELPRHERCCSQHSLAEVFNTVTKTSTVHRASPSQGVEFIEFLKREMLVIKLVPEDYMEAARATADGNLGGPLIYDALLLQGARKVNAETIYTWNVRHFQRLAPDLAGRIRTP